MSPRTRVQIATALTCLLALPVSASAHISQRSHEAPAAQQRVSADQAAKNDAKKYPDPENNCNKAPYRPLVELVYPNPEPIVNQALVRFNTCGMNFLAGIQDSKLTVTMVDGKIQFRDRGTKAWKRLPKQCTPQKVKKGIGALCSIPPRFADGMFLTLWPRLGNDTVIAETLPANIRVWVLLDDGHDVARTGPADDFINGATGRDRIWSGGGSDWVRSGKDDDRIDAGPGDDGGANCDQGETQIVGGPGVDLVIGGPGGDCLYSGPEVDTIRADDGAADRVVCGGGRDILAIDHIDEVRACG